MPKNAYYCWFKISGFMAKYIMLPVQIENYLPAKCMAVRYQIKINQVNDLILKLLQKFEISSGIFWAVNAFL